MKNFVKKNKRILIAGLVFIFATTLVSLALADVGLNVKVTETLPSENAIYGQISATSPGSLMVLNSLATGGHGGVLGDNEVVVDKDGKITTLGGICMSDGCRTNWGGVVTKYAGMSVSAYTGDNNGHPGYAYAHGVCSSTPAILGSHVCAVNEMLTSLVSGVTMPNDNVWILNGPPGFTASANDCNARTQAVDIVLPNTVFGAYWEATSVTYPQGRGLLINCKPSNTLKFACCK